MSSHLVVRGGKPLKGKITAQGAKNAALPVIACALLLKGGSLVIDRVPDLYDINTMASLIRHLGAAVEYSPDTGRMVIDVPHELKWETPPELVRKMRASSLVLGPLIARCGKAVLPLPGGCAIGSRPIDFHMKGLAKMGAAFDLERGAVHADTQGLGLKPANIYLAFPSVGATENLMMTASLIPGVTVLDNAAREPEIVNLAHALQAMGASIEGEGTPTITIEGKKELHSAQISIVPDRIEAGTYLAAGVMTKGSVTVCDVKASHLNAYISAMQEAGADVQITRKENYDDITMSYTDKLQGIELKTKPHPGFPTDLQPQMMALMTMAEGTSVIHESVFEARFSHVEEFKRMGAKIEIQGNMAVVTGADCLNGADVHSSDLRAGAALVIMGLAAEGKSGIYELDHIWRGYDNLVKNLVSIGADVEVIG